MRPPAILRRLKVTHEGPLLQQLLAAMGMKRPDVKQLLKYGAVTVNGAVVRQFDHPLQPGDQLIVGQLQATVAGNRLQAAQIRVLFEDESLIAVDKPAGLFTVATDNEKTDTLFMRVNEYLSGRDPDRSARIAVVHRIDQGTSGIVLFAKSASLRDRLQADWQRIEKHYLAIVEGRPSAARGTITSYLSESKSLKVHSSQQARPEAKSATTHFTVVETRGAWSLLDVRLETGRKHQIRVHLASHGNPIVGDRLYGAQSDPFGRMALHASSLSLPHPVTGEALVIRADLPAGMTRVFVAAKPNR